MLVLAAAALLTSAVLQVEVVPDRQEDTPLEQLLTQQELQQYHKSTRYRDRMNVYARAISRFSIVFGAQAKNKLLDEMLISLGQMESLAHYALKEPEPRSRKEAMGRSARKFEIQLRRLIEDINDAKSIGPYEYRRIFEKTEEDLSALRHRLLKHMFGDVLEPRDDGESETRSGNGVADNFLGSNVHAGRQDGEIRYSGRILGDKFTPQEYVKIQENQELAKRVDVFAKIAESRLAEIKRRLNNEPWKDKDPNPLELFTYEEMIHAYERAISGIMTNIDEKARARVASEKDLRKALEKLNRKVNEFGPQLPPLRELAIKQQDEVLYREVLEAEKTTEIARKGSLYGLGAPAEEKK